MPRYRFPGYIQFLDAAAARIGRPGAAIGRRRIAMLSALGKLLGQVGDAPPEQVEAILAKAFDLRNQLHAAATAADLMIEDVRNEAMPVGLAAFVPPRRG